MRGRRWNRPKRATTTRSSTEMSYDDGTTVTSGAIRVAGMCLAIRCKNVTHCDTGSMQPRRVDAYAFCASRAKNCRTSEGISSDSRTLVCVSIRWKNETNGTVVEFLENRQQSPNHVALHCSKRQFVGRRRVSGVVYRGRRACVNRL